MEDKTTKNLNKKIDNLSEVINSIKEDLSSSHTLSNLLLIEETNNKVDENFSKAAEDVFKIIFQIFLILLGIDMAKKISAGEFTILWVDLTIFLFMILLFFMNLSHRKKKLKESTSYKNLQVMKEVYLKELSSNKK